MNRLYHEETEAMKQFLDSYRTPSTRRMYKRGLTLFCSWYNKTVEEILKERMEDCTRRPDENIVEAKQRSQRFERVIEKFHAWQLENGYSLNTARTNCNGLLQLFRYYQMPLALRNGSPVSQTVVSTKDFVLLPDHVRAMFHVAKDLRSKLLVSLAKDLGWRISDVLSIKRSELPDLDREPPIEWIRITKKEKVVAKTCLSVETVQILKQYLSTFARPDESYLFHNNGSGHVSINLVNRRLKELAEDSGIELGNRSLTFHCFRKMLISVGKNLGIDGDILKLMVGKSVRKDMLAYMTGIDVKTAFNRLQSVLAIPLVGSNGKEVIQEQTEEIEKLERAVTSLQSDVQDLKTREETAVKRFCQQQETIEKLFKYYEASETVIKMLTKGLELQVEGALTSNDLSNKQKIELHQFLKQLKKRFP